MQIMTRAMFERADAAPRTIYPARNSATGQPILLSVDARKDGELLGGMKMAFLKPYIEHIIREHGSANLRQTLPLRIVVDVPGGQGGMVASFQINPNIQEGDLQHSHEEEPAGPPPAVVATVAPAFSQVQGRAGDRARLAQEVANLCQGHFARGIVLNEQIPNGPLVPNQMLGLVTNGDKIYAKQMNLGNLYDMTHLFSDLRRLYPTVPTTLNETDIPQSTAQAAEFDL